MKIQIQDPNVYSDYNPGDQVYLIEWFNELQPKKVNHILSVAVSRTNMSNEPREKGWLGCTNNINKTSMGLFVIQELELVERPVDDQHYAKQGFKDPVATKITLETINE